MKELRTCGIIFCLLCLLLCFSCSFVSIAANEQTLTEPVTETETATTTATTSEPASSEPAVSSEDLPSFENPSTWIVFILALIVGIFLGQALSFWKW